MPNDVSTTGSSGFTMASRRACKQHAESGNACARR
jgi:hypothetical protein